MEFGFTTMNTPYDRAPTELARALEERGYDSLWIGEHSHIPSSRQTPYPAGGAMPEMYKHMMDPFLSLAAAATVTENLLLATGVALPLERDIYALAKAVSTLDHLSGGRFIFGVGTGWNREELADHRPDIPWNDRYLALGDAVHALQALWTGDRPSYESRWFHIDQPWSYPRPVQDPHPPVYFGTAGPTGTALAAAFADGWAPLDIALGDVAAKVTAFRDFVEQNDRDEVPITLVVFGDPDPDKLRRYRDLDVERAVIGAGRTGWDDPSTTYPFLDRFATLIPELNA